MKKIVRKILADITVPVHSILGEKHWDAVARFGERIAAGEGLDVRFIRLFTETAQSIAEEINCGT